MMGGARPGAIHPAMRAACIRGGRPTGMWLLTSAVSRPSRAIAMAPAVSRLCEKKKLLSIVKKPRKNDDEGIAPRAQLQGLERQQHHDEGDPGRRAPSRVPVAERACAAAWPAPARRNSHQREGRGGCRQASTARATRSTAPCHRAAPPAAGGQTAAAMTQAITPSKNSVSAGLTGQGLQALQHGGGRGSVGSGPAPGPARQCLLVGRSPLSGANSVRAQAQTVAQAQRSSAAHQAHRRESGQLARRLGCAGCGSWCSSCPSPARARSRWACWASRLTSSSALGGLLPDHQLERVAAPVRPARRRLNSPVVCRCARSRAAAARLAGGRGGGLRFRRGVHQHLGGRAPDGPDPEGPQRKAGFCRVRAGRACSHATLAG